MLTETDVLIVLILPVLVTLIEIVNGLTARSLCVFGLIPRRSGLFNIVTWHFLHTSFKHYLSNITPLVLFAVLIPLLVGVKQFIIATMVIMLLCSVGVYLLARCSLHIGTSGLVFGLGLFLFSYAIFESQLLYICYALVGIVYYVGLNIKLMNFDMRISFEAHFMGALAGVLYAYHLSYDPFEFNHFLLLLVNRPWFGF